MGELESLKDRIAKVESALKKLGMESCEFNHCGWFKTQDMHTYNTIRPGVRICSKCHELVTKMEKGKTYMV